MFTERMNQINQEIQESYGIRQQFADEKRRLTLILSKIKNEFRISRYLPGDRYRQLVNKQNNYKVTPPNSKRIAMNHRQRCLQQDLNIQPQ